MEVLGGLRDFPEGLFGEARSRERTWLSPVEKMSSLPLEEPLSLSVEDSERLRREAMLKAEGLAFLAGGLTERIGRGAP